MFFIAGMFFVSLFIPNSVWINYSRWAIYLSFVYLFVQMVSVIDAFYLWAEFWAKKYSDGNTCYGCLLIFVSICLYLGTGLIVFYSFKFFWIPGCWGNKALLLTMPLFVIAFTTLVLLRFHPTGSLITSGAISLYGTFLAWNAFLSYPNAKTGTACNPIIANEWSMWVQLSTSLAVAFICTFYWSVSGKSSKTMSGAGVDHIINDEGDDADEEEVLELNEEAKRNAESEGGNVPRLIDKVEEGGKNDYSAYEDNSYLKFHGFMLLYGIYLSPLFTNWGNTTFEKGGGYNYGDSNQSAPFYIKILIYICSMLLYLWTLIAPKVLTGRDFGEPIERKGGADGDYAAN